MRRLLLALLALLVAAPVAAQEWQVARDQFPFVGTRLTIQVDVEAPGSLQLIRGEPGSVRVASRAQDGFTAAGLADGDRLTLSAAGEGPVDYLVSVPENARVEVRLPGRSRSERVPRGRSGSWDWNATERPLQAPVTEWVPGMTAGGDWDGSLYTTFSSDRAPEVISIPDLSVLKRVSVRFEGDRFKVVTGRPLSVHEGNDSRMVIRTVGPPMELVLLVPTTAEGFSLQLGGDLALIQDGDQMTTLCTPVIQQWLSDDRRWFTFNPQDGSLHCGGDSVQRHGG